VGEFFRDLLADSGEIFPGQGGGRGGEYIPLTERGMGWLCCSGIIHMAPVGTNDAHQIRVYRAGGSCFQPLRPLTNLLPSSQIPLKPGAPPDYTSMQLLW